MMAALMKMLMMRFDNFDDSGDDNLDGDDDNDDNMTEIFSRALCSTQCVHFDLVHPHAWHRSKVTEMVVNVMMINDHHRYL